MAERVRFYMDEHVPRAVTEGLRRRGVDVLTPNDAGLLTVDDESHLAFALGQTRVMFTQDDDFLRLHALNIRHAGIVYAKQGTPIGIIVSGLMLIHDALGPEDMVGQVEFIR